MALATLATAAMAGPVGWYLAEGQAPAFERFGGQLSSEIVMDDVIAPDGATIAKVLVEEGNYVEDGQPLALVEWRDLERQRQDLQREAVALFAEVQCLARGPTAGATGDDAPGAEKGDLELAKDLSRASCDIQQTRDMTAVARLWDQAESLGERLTLLDGYYQLTRQQLKSRDPAAADDRAAQLERAIKIGLARNVVSEDLSKVKRRMRSAHLHIKQLRLARLGDTKSQLDAVLSKLADLEALEDKRYVVAPRPGIVRYVRSGLVGDTPAPATPIMRVAASDDPSLIVRADLGAEDFSRFDVGDTARMRVSALPAGGPVLAGRVARLYMQQQGRELAYIAEIVVGPDAIRAASTQSILPLAPGAFSYVDVEIARHSLQQSAWDTVARQGDLCRHLVRWLPGMCRDYVPAALWSAAVADAEPLAGPDEDAIDADLARAAAVTQAH